MGLMNNTPAAPVSNAGSNDKKAKLEAFKKRMAEKKARQKVALAEFDTLLKGKGLYTTLTAGTREWLEGMLLAKTERNVAQPVLNKLLKGEPKVGAQFSLLDFFELTSGRGQSITTRLKEWGDKGYKFDVKEGAKKLDTVYVLASLPS